MRVLMPLYRGIRDMASLKKIDGSLSVPMGSMGEAFCAVQKSVLPNTTVPVYFLDHEYYFNRQGLYGDTPSIEYGDNGERFTFLSKAALAFCRHINFRPHIIHSHDWHTGPISLFLRAHLYQDDFFEDTRSIFTIHNMQYQGIFPLDMFSLFNLDWYWLNPNTIEHFGGLNFLKCGIAMSHKLNTVSEGYAQEIKTSGYAYGLDGEICARGNDFIGIRNGIDASVWNPATDKLLPAKYSAKDISGKAICKSTLQKKLGLPVRDDIPMLGIVSRLVEQKGVDILCNIAHELAHRNIQFVLLGTGNKEIENSFRDLAYQNPESVAVTIGYSEELAHQIEAACDFYIMPSRFEPCGLNQMYSLAYGSVPIVRATGGLNDSVQNIDEENETGTGIKFYDLNESSLINTIDWGLKIWFSNPKLYKKIQKNGMKQNNHWKKAAEKYLKMYQSA